MNTDMRISLKITRGNRTFSLQTQLSAKTPEEVREKVSRLASLTGGSLRSPAVFVGRSNYLMEIIYDNFSLSYVKTQIHPRIPLTLRVGDNPDSVEIVLPEIVNLARSHSINKYLKELEAAFGAEHCVCIPRDGYSLIVVYFS